MNHSEQENHDRAIAGLCLATAIILLGLMLAVFGSGCNSVTITNNRGTISIDQHKNIAPSTSATGIPGI